MSLILLLMQYSRILEFQIFVLRVNILFRVEFDGEAESEAHVHVQIPYCDIGPDRERTTPCG